MKKLSAQQRLWFAKKAIAGKFRNRRKSREFGTYHTSLGKQKVITKTHRQLPVRLCLHQDLEIALSFVSELRKVSSRRTGQAAVPKAVKRGKPRQIRGYWDFTTLKKISSGAALILAAEFDRIFKIGKVAPSAVDIEKWDPEVYSTLLRLGFFNAMGFNDQQILQFNPLSDRMNEAFHIMPMVVGDGLNTEPIIEPIRELMSKTMANEESSVALSGALIDAIENVNYHAYPPNYPGIESVPHSWWLSGSVASDKKQLTVSIYDQGVTIPTSMKLSGLWNGAFKAWERLAKSNIWEDPKIDQMSLRWAFNRHETGTGLAHRGKGLPNIREMVAECPEGTLLVLSGKAKYLYVNGRETFEMTNAPLLGTYVEMSATFAGKSVTDNE